MGSGSAPFHLPHHRKNKGVCWVPAQRQATAWLCLAEEVSEPHCQMVDFLPLLSSKQDPTRGRHMSCMTKQRQAPKMCLVWGQNVKPVDCFLLW